MTRQIPLALGFLPRTTFDQYWPGPNTPLVRQLQDIADGGGVRFLYLWGPDGWGKSHLLQAACQRAHQRGRSVSYLPMQVLRALGPDVFEGLEQQGLVCIDDIDAALGELTNEQALFRLYNQLRDHDTALVVSASAPPRHLKTVLADLRSRLSWGLVFRLLPLNEQDTLAAVDVYARQLGLELSPQVSRFLFAHCRRDFTSLRGVLERLDEATLAAKRKLTIPFIKALLGELA